MAEHRTPAPWDTTRSIQAGLVLLAGAAAVVVLGLTRRDLPEEVAVIGATLALAWLVERRHRFLGSGCVLLGLGIGLTVAEHVDQGRYRDQLIFAGIAAGLGLIRACRGEGILPAALALLSVALFEFALQYLPTVIHAAGLYRAFEDGWAFGVLIGVEACVVLTLAGLHLRAPSEGHPASDGR